MSRATRNSVFLVLLLATAAPSAFALDLGGHNRDGVVVVLDMGHGWTSVQLVDGNGVSRETGDSSTFTGAFKVGWARSDKLVAFVGISGWRRGLYGSLSSSSMRNFNFLTEVYWYPTGEGFWFKGGVGAGSLDFWVDSYSEFSALSFKESGFIYSLGAGYELRGSDTMAVGINYEYNNLDMGDFEVLTGVSMANHILGITLRWYQP